MSRNPLSGLGIVLVFAWFGFVGAIGVAVWLVLYAASHLSIGWTP
jgi:hypothetical protein